MVHDDDVGDHLARWSRLLRCPGTAVNGDNEEDNGPSLTGTACVADGTLWVECRVHAADAARHQQLVAFLRLLALLQVADPAAAAAVLRGFLHRPQWDALGLLPGDTDAWAARGLRIGVHALCEGVEDEEALLNGRDHVAAMDGSIFETLQAELVDAIARSRDSRVLTPLGNDGIPVVVVFADTNAVQSELSRISETLVIADAWRRATADAHSGVNIPRRPSPGLVVVECRFLRDWLRIGISECVLLSHLRTSCPNLRIGALAIEDISQDPPTMSLSPWLLEELLSPGRNGLTSLGLDTTMNATSWTAIMAAIYTGNSAITELRLDRSPNLSQNPPPRPEQLGIMAQWLAVALARADSRHRVWHLSIDCAVTQVEWILAMVNRLGGVSVVPGSLPVTANDYVRLRLGSLLHRNPPQIDNAALDEADLLKDPMTRFLIMPAERRATPGWEQVISPLGERLWVKSDDIASRHSEDTGNVNGLCRISRFTLNNVNAAALGPLLGLFQHVGPHVRELTIDHCDEVTVYDFNEWLLSVLKCCSNLDLLRLEGLEVGSLDVITSAVESGLCRIKSLHVCAPACLFESSPGFSAALGDWAHPLSTHLFELTVQMEESDVGKTLCELLNTSTRLVRCSVQCSTQALLKEFEGRLTKTHGQEVSVRRGPLKLPCKMALLSAICRLSGNFDDKILGAIFEFAAEVFAREVFVY